MNNLKKIERIIICVIVGSVVLLLITVGVVLSYHCLVVREFPFLTEKITDEIKIVVLSDLHDHKFGVGNQKLVDKVQKIHPDLILLDGDIINEDSQSAEVLLQLIQKLKFVAPVYTALGNHERIYMEKHPEFVSQIEDAGAVFLDKIFKDVMIGERKLRLGGLYDYAFTLDDVAMNSEIEHFLEDFQNTDSLKIMMSHRPDSFIFGDASVKWKIDLVVSGHDHGGQVVLPFIGGLYGGDQGWFPQFVHGMKKKDDMKIFVTSGLGSNSQILPRFLNPPEIALIRIKNALG